MKSSYWVENQHVKVIVTNSSYSLLSQKVGQVYLIFDRMSLVCQIDNMKA